MQLAEAGNVTMLIWLGKQILGQRDMTALEHSAAGGETLEIIVTKVGESKSNGENAKTATSNRADRLVPHRNEGAAAQGATERLLPQPVVSIPGRWL